MPGEAEDFPPKWKSPSGLGWEGNAKIVRVNPLHPSINPLNIGKWDFRRKSCIPFKLFGFVQARYGAKPPPRFGRCHKLSSRAIDVESPEPFVTFERWLISYQIDISTHPKWSLLAFESWCNSRYEQANQVDTHKWQISEIIHAGLDRTVEILSASKRGQPVIRFASRG